MVGEPFTVHEAQAEPGTAPTLAAVRSRLAVLERTPTFFACPAADLRLLARRARHLAVPAGRAIVTQGEGGDSMYVVAAGQCEVSVAESPGHSVTISVLGPGDAFGVECVAGEGRRPATVRTVVEVELLVIDRATTDLVLLPGSEALDAVRRLVAQQRTTIELLLERSKALAPKQSATRVVVYSPKGGSGRTTVAVNLAAHLARSHPGEVLVLDLALPYNHAALMTNLVPTGSLAQLGPVPPAHFEEALLSAVLHHQDGLMVLPGVMRPEEAELVTPELIERAFEVIDRSFRYVIVDTSQYLGDALLSVLERAHRILVLATPELSTLKDVVELKRIFRDVLHIVPARLMIAVNHRTAKGVITLQDVEANLEQSVLCEIPFEGGRLDEAAVRGEILSAGEGRSALARAVATIAETLTGVTAGSIAQRPSRRRFGLG